MMQDFQVLFNDRTEDLVRWLFENLAPSIKLAASKIEKTTKQDGSGTAAGGGAAAGSGAAGTAGAGQDLLDAFEGDEDSEFQQQQTGGYRGKDNNMLGKRNF